VLVLLTGEVSEISYRGDLARSFMAIALSGQAIQTSLPQHCCTTAGKVVPTVEGGGYSFH
jgi:hypothetical protein